MPGNIHSVPLTVIESWPKPNYVNPVMRSWLPAFSLAWQIVSTALVGPRIWLRITKQAGPFGLDDFFILVAWAFSVVLTAGAWVDSTQYGIYRHTWDVPLDEYTGAALIGWVAQLVMLVSTCSTKASVLLFYQRMAVSSLNWKWRLAIYLALAFTALYFLGILLALLLVCQPLSAYWMSYDFNWKKPYTCVDATFINPIVGVLSIVSDIYACVLPCLMLRAYNLNISKRQKIGLNVLFGLGALVACAGIARTHYLIQLGQTYDTSWTGFDLYVWSIVECQLAIICASAPHVRTFFRCYFRDTIQQTFSRFERSKQDTQHSMKISSSKQRYGHMLEAKCAADAIDMRVLTKPSLDAGNEIEVMAAGLDERTSKIEHGWYAAEPFVNRQSVLLPPLCYLPPDSRI